MSDHEKYMRLAIELAKKAEGMTSPNPMVGAVIVKGGKIIGRGYHKKAGLPHAEINAIRQASKRARGATLYVTLEPCDHFGKTPPCTDAVIGSGIRKVVIGMKDPNPINNGRGIKELKRNGITAKAGILESEARDINKPYIKYITAGMPYVTLKMAQSLDGKIATRQGESRWITSAKSRRYVQSLRAKADAVMVGVNTVLKDDPMLISKIKGSRQPARVIVDSRLSTPLTARLFSSAKCSSIFIVTTKRYPKARLIEKKCANVLVVKSKAGRVDLKDLLKRLGKMGIMHLLVEGGGELAAGFIEEGLADKIMFFIAPKIIGGKDALTSVEGRGVDRIEDAVALKDMNAKRIGGDILIEAEL